VLRAGEQIGEQSFAGPLLRLVAVFPASQRRQRHQDRFSAAIGLEAKDGSPVPDKIEFNVSAASIQLELTFTVAVGETVALLDDRCVGREECLTIGPRKIMKLLPGELH